MNDNIIWFWFYSKFSLVAHLCILNELVISIMVYSGPDGFYQPINEAIRRSDDDEMKQRKTENNKIKQVLYCQIISRLQI